MTLQKGGGKGGNELKADPATASIPVIALTAYSMRGDRERFLGAGCVDHMSKPIDLGTFGEDIARVLRDSR